MSSTSLRQVTNSNQQSMGTIIVTSLASGAATLIVALAIGWLTIARSAVGREEVVELITSNTPYIREREALQNGVAHNTRSIEELTTRLRNIEQQGHRVEAKLDLLLSEFVERQFSAKGEESP